MQDLTYPTILNGLLREEHELDMKVGVLHAILEKTSLEAINAAPILFGPLADSLLDDIVLTIAKLYEKDSERSVYKLLNAAAAQAKRIPWRTPITQEVLANHQADIERQEAILRSIETRRNKYIAHYDKTYFDNPNQVDADFPISANQVISVLQSTQAILRTHESALTGSMRMSMGCFAYAATERMVLALTEAASNRRLKGT